MKTKQQYVILDGSFGDLPSSALDYIQFFQDHLNSVPEEFRTKVTIDVERDLDGYTLYSMYYYRPLTNEELADELRQGQLNEERRLQYKRKEFERLKRELGEE